MSDKDELTTINANLKLPEVEEVGVRKRAFERYEVNKKKASVADLATKLASVPQFIEAFNKAGMKVLDISREVATKIQNGELVFVRKPTTGQELGMLRDTATNHFALQVPIKDIPLDLSNALATASLSVALADLSNKLDQLDQKINRVNRNFDLDRYAQVQAAGDKLKLAVLTHDAQTKKTLLLDSLSQATNAKNLLLNQLYESKSKFKQQAEKSGVFKEIKSIAVPSNEFSQVALDALDNLYYLKDAFSFQVSGLAELGEYDALNFAVSDFRDLILEDFSGEDALLLDGYLPPSTTNPFKFLSEGVVASADTIIDCLDNNEDLLETHFVPAEIATAEV